MRSFLSVASALSGLFASSAAIAGANKTWVSSTGADSGTCAITAPCKTFQYAVNQTNAGGEVDVKDSGGYGTVYIGKAISIVAEGVLASISVPAGGTGINVQAGLSNVVLHGLTIDGHSLGNGHGIYVGSNVTITKCAIRNLEFAIDADGLTESVSNPVIILQDSEMTGNVYGLYIGIGTASVGNSRIFSNQFGILDSADNVVFSFGDNYFFNNSLDYAQSISTVDKH